MFSIVIKKENSKRKWYYYAPFDIDYDILCSFIKNNIKLNCPYNYFEYTFKIKEENYKNKIIDRLPIVCLVDIANIIDNIKYINNEIFEHIKEFWEQNDKIRLLYIMYKYNLNKENFTFENLKEISLLQEILM